MVHTTGNVHFLLKVAEQLAKANVHFELTFDGVNNKLETQHQSTLYRAIEAAEKLSK